MYISELKSFIFENPCATRTQIISRGFIACIIFCLLFCINLESSASTKCHNLSITNIDTSRWQGFDFVIDSENVDIVASVLKKEVPEDGGRGAVINSYEEVVYYHADQKCKFQTPMHIAEFSSPNFLQTPAKITRSNGRINILIPSKQELARYESLNNGQTWTKKEGILPMEDYQISSDTQITPFIHSGNIYVFYEISGKNFKNKRWMLGKWEQNTGKVLSNEISKKHLTFGSTTPTVFFDNDHLYMGFINYREPLNYLVMSLDQIGQNKTDKIFSYPISSGAVSSVKTIFANQNKLFMLIESTEERGDTDSPNILKDSDVQYKILIFQKERPDILEQELLVNLKQDTSQYTSSCDSFNLYVCQNNLVKLFWQDMRCSPTAKTFSKWPLWVPYMLSGKTAEDLPGIKRTIGNCCFNLGEEQRTNRVTFFGNNVRKPPEGCTNPVVLYSDHKCYVLWTSNKLYGIVFEERQ